MTEIKADETFRLPVPDRLEPKRTTRNLMVSVRVYFFALYNSSNKSFQELLKSVGNKDAVTGNRLFDRHEAILMIKEAADDAKDTIVTGAKDGEIYKCLSNIMSQNHLGLKQRRVAYHQQAHSAPAE